MTAVTKRGPRKRHGKGHSKQPGEHSPRSATPERSSASDRRLRRNCPISNPVMSDKRSDGSRRARRPASSTVVAVLSTLCATLLVVGSVSLARYQLPAAVGSDSGLRSSEATAVSGAIPREAAEATSVTPTTDKDASLHVSRKLSRRPELKTRGGQLAYARFSLLAEYAHDSAAFTQGLCYLDGYLYESTGLLGGKSSIRKVDPKTGEVVQVANLDRKYFGEGMVILGNEIHSLTWRSKVGFTWDLKSFELKKTFNFSTKTGQGWGITTDGESLIVSDGSQYLFFWDPNTMQETRRVEVLTLEGRPLTRINELEMVKGFVFANVWFDDSVYKINPATGDVVDSYSFEELYPKALRRKETTSKDAVLNGIAWDPQEDVLYVTGKLWPRMYKVKLHDGFEDEEVLVEEEVVDVMDTVEEGNGRRIRQLRSADEEMGHYLRE